MATDELLPAGSWGRRRIVLLLVVLLVFVGLGLGALVVDDPGDDPPEVPVTPADDTPAPPPDDGPPADDGIPTDDVAPSDDPPTDDDTGDDAPTQDDEPTDDPPAMGGGAGSGPADDGTSPSVSLETVGSTVFLDVDNVIPGDDGREAVVLRNAGDTAAELSIDDVDVTDLDSGDGPGKLSEHLLVIFEVHYPDGTVGYLYDTESGARTLAALDDEVDPATGDVLEAGEEATVVLDWELPASTGNEVQGDALEFDVIFGLQSSGN